MAILKTRSPSHFNVKFHGNFMATPPRFSFALKATFPALLAALSTSASGEPASEPPAQQPSHLMQQCLGLPDMQRLACYDRIATQAAPQALPEAATQPHATWDTAISTDLHSEHSPVSAPGPDEAPSQVQDAGHAVSAAQVNFLPPPSPMERMWELRSDTDRPAFSLQAYQPNYVLFAQYGDRVNRRPTSPASGRQSTTTKDYRHVEAKFQLSFRSKLAQDIFRQNDSVWFGYTQVSQWQVWSPGISRPFRATSYKPEFIYVIPIQYRLPGTTWSLRMAGIGLIHESNGQSNPLSRSWNRVYVGLGLDSNNMSIYARFWKRFPESGNDDDNPDITTYMGRADIRLNWELGYDNTIGLTFASNLRNTSKGSIQLDYYFPLSRLWGMGDYLRGYIQVFHGYGETITDYNFRRTTFGIGVAIKEW